MSKKNKLDLRLGDSLDILKKIPDNFIDSIVTDPPYGIGFMGKGWDKVLPPTEIWKECLRVLKPGGYLVAMSAARTFHRLAVQLEDMGMICHPMIGWIYGSGFPKATDLSKQFDKQAGAEREVVGIDKSVGKPRKTNNQFNAIQESDNGVNTESFEAKRGQITAPSTDLAKQWEGYKYGLQSLKPALEPIAVFQKPWKNKKNKRMTDNVKEFGVGPFNIDVCRVETNDIELKELNRENKRPGGGASGFMVSKDRVFTPSQGRYPANLLHDGSECVEEFFPECKPAGNKCQQSRFKNTNGGSFSKEYNNQKSLPSDSGSASRFFNKLPITDLDAPFLYTAKPSKRERNEGLESIEPKQFSTMGNGIGAKSADKTAPQSNLHPTVKPIKLMEWLIKLVTPEGGITLDPFMGSGTTGIAAERNNFNFVGIEREEEFFNIAKARINHEREKRNETTVCNENDENVSNDGEGSEVG